VEGGPLPSFKNMTRVVIHRDKSALLLLAICALIGLALAVLPGCATDTGNASKDRAGRVTNAIGEELFNSILAFGLGEGRAYLTGQNGQDAAAAAFQAASSGILSTGGIQRIVSAYAGPEVANVVAEKFAAVAPATPAQAAITSNIIGSALQTAANQLAE
jgi:hypothetical protein